MRVNGVCTISNSDFKNKFVILPTLVLENACIPDLSGNRRISATVGAELLMRAHPVSKQCPSFQPMDFMCWFFWWDGLAIQLTTTLSIAQEKFQESSELTFGSSNSIAKCVSSNICSNHLRDLCASIQIIHNKVRVPVMRGSERNEPKISPTFLLFDYQPNSHVLHDVPQSLLWSGSGCITFVTMTEHNTNPIPPLWEYR